VGALHLFHVLKANAVVLAIGPGKIKGFLFCLQPHISLPSVVNIGPAGSRPRRGIRLSVASRS
jgi:hypothetical protein